MKTTLKEQIVQLHQQPQAKPAPASGLPVSTNVWAGEPTPPKLPIP